MMALRCLSSFPTVWIKAKHRRYSLSDELVNYRINGSYYVVDRLFGAAELRLGEKDQSVVRILRKKERKSRTLRAGGNDA